MIEFLMSPIGQICFFGAIIVVGGFFAYRAGKKKNRDKD